MNEVGGGGNVVEGEGKRREHQIRESVGETVARGRKMTSDWKNERCEK